MALTLAAAWAVLVAAGVVLELRRPARIADLVRRAPAGTRRQLSRRVRAAVAFVIPLPVASPPVNVVLGLVAAGVLWWLPALQRRRAEKLRLAHITDGVPEVVDLLVLAVGAGLTVPLALDAVSRRATGELADELGRAVAVSQRGHRLADALDDVPTRCGDAVRPLIAALAASERYGAPLLDGLERVAADVRASRRRRADEAARKVSVKLLFPLVLCILPAFALLTVAPLIASALRSLRL